MEDEAGTDPEPGPTNIELSTFSNPLVEDCSRAGHLEVEDCIRTGHLEVCSFEERGTDKVSQERISLSTEEFTLDRKEKICTVYQYPPNG
ncbi:hypothetical protein ACHWQZ_G000211 [Mnemiopsis leidyi]